MKSLILTDHDAKVLLGAVLWTAATNPNLTAAHHATLRALDRQLMERFDTGATVLVGAVSNRDQQAA